MSNNTTPMTDPNICSCPSDHENCGFHGSYQHSEGLGASSCSTFPIMNTLENLPEISSDALFCCKCRSKDLNTDFVAKGKLLTASARGRSPSEFIQSSEHDFFWAWSAKKDHLHITCRNCQYNWRQPTADSNKNSPFRPH